MTVFRKVSVKERLPNKRDVYFTIMDNHYPNPSEFKGDKWVFNGRDFNEVTHWLEEVHVPSIDEISAEADRQFPAGRHAEADGFKRGGQWMFNRILRKLK